MKLHIIPSENENQYFSRIKEDKKHQKIEQYISCVLDKVKREFDISDTIFLYILSDAWGRNRITIRIKNLNKDNVIFLKKNDNLEEIYTIEISKIEKLICAIKEYETYFLSKNYYIENSNILDGSIYEIFLSSIENVYWFNCDNLDSYSDDDNSCPNVKILIKLMNEIFSILKKSNLGIHYKYLELR